MKHTLKKQYERRLMWHYTNGKEDLFTLSECNLVWFLLICEHA